MGVLSQFDPSSAAQYWLNEKDRKPKVGSKSRTQEWFRGVFEEAGRQHFFPESSPNVESQSSGRIVTPTSTIRF